MRYFKILLLIIITSSCASYVDKLHKEMRGEEIQRGRDIQSIAPTDEARSVVGSDDSKRYIADDFLNAQCLGEACVYE